MEVIQAARALGKAIQEDPRYIRTMQAQDHNDTDTELQQSIGDFNRLRTELSQEMQKSDKDTDKVKEMDSQLKAMYTEIFKNENMIEFTEARNDLQVMLTFINQIITGSAGGQDPDSIEYQESCGGDCGGCSGCS